MATRKTALPAKKVPRRPNVVVDRGDVAQRIKPIKSAAAIGDAVRVGRPPRWSSLDLKLVTELCMLGLSNEELGAHFGLNASTIGDWMNGRVKDPAEVADFVSAVKEGRGIADAKVAGSLYARAVGYEYDEQVAVAVGKGEVVLTTVRKKMPPDVAAAFIWLKNRRRKDWKDKHEDAPDDPQAAAKVIRDAVKVAMATVEEPQAPIEGGEA